MIELASRLTPARQDINRVDVDGINRSWYSQHVKTGPFTSDWHRHNKAQLLYAEGGVVHLQNKRRSLLLPAHHGAWIPANMEHRMNSASPELYLRTVYFDEPCPEEVVLRDLNVFPISSLAREMVYYTKIWNSQTTNPDEVERSFFHTLRILLPQWAAATMPLTLPTTDHVRLRPMLEHVIAHLEKDIQVEDLASRFGASSRTVMRLFQNELGMGFSTYLRVARVIKALDLFSRPGMNVSSVCYAVGYESISAFSNTFRQLVGLRPNQYLKMALQSQYG
ncbi:MAG: helix-turn-helix transcriptional regulator [Gammaproteobacteria bacterium]|nr:helix-turn-helix transcriptional regulator [Gammaproteobacteria bacterium]